jgi:ABC-type multidrug transport system fused ATPase/permease subunit
MLLVRNWQFSVATMLTLWPIAIEVAFSTQKIGFFFTSYQKTASAVNRIQEIDGMPAEADDTQSPQNVADDCVLRFDNVCFTYDNDNYVLSNVSFVINQGEKVCIVGESGSGKSTIVRLILMFYAANDGEIYLYGQPLCPTSNVFRSRIAYIPQTPKLFIASIRDNIKMGNLCATDDQVLLAAQKASAHQFIEKLPQKYETILGKEGFLLSGGEQQRIAIARAYMKDNNALMLCDEITSALDRETEKVIIDTLWTEKSRTLICVTHHLQNAKRADKIIVMKDGYVAEIGTHDELMVAGQHYYSLWQSNQNEPYVK